MALRSLTIDLGMNIAGFTADSNKAARVATRMSKRIEKDLVQTAKRVTASFATIGASVTGTVLQFAKFEQSIAKVGAVSGATGRELEKLGDAALKYAASTRFNPEQTTQALYSLSSAGQSVNQQLATLPNVLNLAEAAGADLGKSTELLVSSMAQFGIAAEDSGRVADVLVASISNSATNVERLQVAMRNAGSVASSFNQSFEDTVTAVSILTTSFGNGEKAGTAFSSGLDQLLKNGEKIGVSMLDASGNIRPFVDVLEDIENQGISSAEIIKTLGKEGGTGLAALVNKGTQAFKDMRDSLQSSGQAADVARQQMDTLQADIDKLGSTFKTTAIELGRVASENLNVREFLQSLTSVLNELIKNADSVVQSAITLTKVISGLVIARTAAKAWKLLGLQMIITGKGMEKAGINATVATKATGALGIAARTAAVGVGTLKKAFAFLGGPVGVITLSALAIYEFATAERDAIAGTKEFADETNRLAESFRMLNIQERVQQISEAGTQLQELINARAGMQDFADARGIDLSSALQKNDKAIEAVKQRIQQLNTEYLDLQNQEQKATEETKKLETAFSGLGVGVDTATKVLDDLSSLLSQYGTDAEKLAIIEANKNKEIAKFTKEGKLTEKVLAAINKKYNEQANAIVGVRSVLKKLRSEHRPIQAMFQDLSNSMKALEDAKLLPDFSDAEYSEGFELIQEQAENIASEIVDKVKGVYEEIPALFGGVVEDIEDVDLSKVFDGFAEGLNPAIGALKSFKEEIGTINKLTESGSFSVGQQAFYSTGIAAEFALNSMAGMAQEGSDAQRKLAAAAAITNTVLGITAILEQGKGDPYTAFARMAAMAAMVASMGVQVAGAFGGSGGGGAEQQQERQGTGTVLGNANAKSESIGNSLDLIAKASNKIVGINSKMLRSLNTMNDAIAGTVTEIGKLGEIGDLGTSASARGGILGGVISGLIFGGSKVTDRGVQILSGGIAEAIDGTLFEAYEVARRRSLFGSRTRTNTGALDEGITNQIGLIFESMNDTILAGAEALGVNLDDVQRALDAYQIEEQRISLLDLDADEQRAELEAVFSSIFDGLTAFSIPFITQFQQAGEGLGETLSRVATTVLVFEEAIESMGLEFIEKQVDPELFAQAAVAIADFAGGMDVFIDGYSAYVSKFLSETEQFNIIAGRIGGIFDDLELALPNTREGFTQLIQSLDLTTASGQEAFGTLISLSDELDSFYGGLEGLWDSFFDTFYTAGENAQRELSQATQNRDQLLGNLGFEGDVTEQQFKEVFESLLPTLSAEAVTQWLEAAEAIGAVIDAEGALTSARADLTRITDDINETLARTNLSGFSSGLRDIAQQYNENIRVARNLGATEQELAMIQSHATRQIQRAIQQLESNIGSAVTDLYGTQLDQINSQIELLESQQNSIGQVAQASSNRYAEELAAIKQIQDLVKSLTLNSQLSPLNPLQQLNEAQSQFDALFAAAQGGDINAQQQLPTLVEQLLGLRQDVFASQGYDDFFNGIIGQLESLGVTREPENPQNTIIGQNSQMIELLAERNRLEAEFDSQARLDAALAIANQIAELVSVTGESFGSLAERLGLPVEQFLADLGVSLDELTVETTLALANTANTLGIEVTELAQSVGFSLGELADQNSLINDALEQTILGLPAGIQGSLGPLLYQIERATDASQREALLAEFVAIADTLPEDERNALAPFFENIDPTSDAQTQIGLMESLNQSQAEVLFTLQEMIASQSTDSTQITNSILNLTGEQNETNTLLRQVLDQLRVATP